MRKNTYIKEKIPEPVLKDYKFLAWCATLESGFRERFDPTKIVTFDDDDVYVEAEWEALPHTSVTKIDSFGSGEVNFQGLAPCTIILAGYKDGSLAELQYEDFEAAYSSWKFTMNKDFDTLKVLTWNSLSGMVPLYECVTIDRKAE